MKTRFSDHVSDLTMKNTVIADKQFDKSSFTRVIFENVVFENLDVKGCDFSYCRFINCTFNKCRVENNDFDGCILNNIVFSESQLITQTILKCISRELSFIRCSELTLKVKFSKFVGINLDSVEKIEIFREESKFYSVPSNFFDYVMEADEYFFEIKEQSQKLRVEKLTAMKLRKQLSDVNFIRKSLFFIFSATMFLFLLTLFHFLNSRNIVEDIQFFISSTSPFHLILIVISFFILWKFLGIWGNKKQIEYEECKRDIKIKMESK